MVARRGSRSDWERQARLAQQAVQRQRREAERSKITAEREAKQQHAEDRAAAVERRNQGLQAAVQRLESLLRSGLGRPAGVEIVQRRDPPRLPPLELGADAQPISPPSWDTFEPQRPGRLSRALGGEARYQRDLEAARAEHQRAVRAAAEAEATRQHRVEAARSAHADQIDRIQAADARRLADDAQRRQSFEDRAPEAVADQVGRVLAGTPLPADFPRRAEVTFDPRSEQVIIECELPSRDLMPPEASFRYLKTKDEIRSTPRTKADIDGLYRSVISQVALLTIRDVFDSDAKIDSVAFNGFVDAINPATGELERCHLISLNVQRSSFPADEKLAAVTPEACVRHLRAVVSSHPYELKPIQPILDFDLSKYNFAEGLDAVATLDARPDLMQMPPTMFEHLVRQIFIEQGAEGWTTEQSKDDGVDAVIAQRNSLIGGLSIVQAKRYSRVIGVSHLRELAGAMEEKKAGFGILITTSWFTSGCWTKMREHGRMELIDGHRLTYLIKKFLDKDVLIGIPNRPPPREGSRD